MLVSLLSLYFSGPHKSAALPLSCPTYARQTCGPQCPKAWFYDFLLLLSCLAIFLLLKTLRFLTNNLRGLSYINVISVKLLGTLRVAHDLKPVPDYSFEEIC